MQNGYSAFMPLHVWVDGIILYVRKINSYKKQFHLAFVDKQNFSKSVGEKITEYRTAFGMCN